jgi:hypothetical protein
MILINQGMLQNGEVVAVKRLLVVPEIIWISNLQMKYLV